MVAERVSGYQPRPVEREPEPRETQRAREEVATKQTPEQARAESIAKKPKAAVRTLGSRIDVYA